MLNALDGIGRGAFDGVRVLDVSQAVAGPFCTKLLAGYGASVLKVERPGRGDVARHAGPFLRDVPHPERSGLFLHLNTGKRSVTLDLSRSTGQAMFRELAQQADLVVESYRPGTMAKFGLDYESLRSLKPSLVVVSISNFGQTGPYRDYEALDLSLQAIGGPQMNSQGQPGREPLKYPGNEGQYFAGLTTALATAGALVAARLHGIGQHVDMSIVETLLASAENKGVDYIYTGQVYGRESNTARWSYLMGAFPCKDGFIGLQGSGRGETWWPRVYRLIGKPELSDDPRFSTPEAREAHRDEFDVYWYEWLAEHTRAEVFAAAQQARFPLAPVYTPEDLVRDPHFQARGFFDRIALASPAPIRNRGTLSSCAGEGRSSPLQHSWRGTPGGAREGEASSLVQPGAPFKMGVSGWQGARRAPLLGEHNLEVYCGELGMSTSDVRRLRAAGVV